MIQFWTILYSCTVNISATNLHIYALLTGVQEVTRKGPYGNSAQVFEHPSAVSWQRVCTTTLQHLFRHHEESWWGQVHQVLDVKYVISCRRLCGGL